MSTSSDLVMSEVFSTLVTQDALGAEIRVLEAAADPEAVSMLRQRLHAAEARADKLRLKLSEQETAHRAHKESSKRDFFTEERRRLLVSAASRCISVRLTIRERLLRGFATWRHTALLLCTLVAHKAALHSEDVKRLRRELLACEDALATHRGVHMRLHTECERLRGASAELTRRVELEESRNQTLLDVGQKASERAKIASRELLASRHELVEMTAALGALENATGSAGGRRLGR